MSSRHGGSTELELYECINDVGLSILLALAFFADLSYLISPFLFSDWLYFGS